MEIEHIYGPKLRYYGKDIKSSNLSVIAGCAHAAHLEKPEIFNKIVKDFLKNS